MAKRDDEKELSSGAGAGMIGESGGQEDWHEDPSPVDDFEESGDDASAEVEEDEVESDETSEDAPVQKKGSWIPVVVGVLAFAFAGTLAFFQFGGVLSSGTSSPMPVAAIVNENSAEKQAEPLQPIASQDVSASDVSTLYAGGKASGGYGSSVDVNSGSGPLDNTKGLSSDPMTVSSGQAIPAQEPVVAPIAASQNNTTLDASSLNVPSPADVTTAPAVAPSALNAAPKTSSAVAPLKSTVDVSVYESKILGMSSRIEGLEKALSQATKQIEQMNASLSNIQAANVKATTRAEKAEKAKGESKATPKAVEKTEPAVTLLGEPQAETSSSVTAETAKEETAPVVEKKEAKKGETQSKAEKAKTAVKTEKTSSRLVLRAATESAAWVSKGAESSELQQVEVGQSLSGIGKVKEIRQVGDHWEVIGTKGVLR